MMTNFEKPFQDLKDWAAQRGIEIQCLSLPPGKAGEFTGAQVRMNCDYGAEERTYYLVHALGSIVIWSLNKAAVQGMFDELREAKQKKSSDPSRLERAITAYREFETESSELAAWLLAQLGWSSMLDSFATFMRADLESMTEFHRTDHAPVWRDFLVRWNEEVCTGQRHIEPFQLHPMPSFRAIPIEKQEILQQQA